MSRIAETEPLDFIQLTYNIADREAEMELLPLAAERNIAVIANRPFREGALLERLNGVSLPGVAAEIGAATWPQFLLKFIISHPAVMVTIPATRRVDHMIENMGAMSGDLRDADQRNDMIRAFGSI
jgi:aryl-alcohol dehydrogenase-like predicted oxidoreductase